MDPRKLTVFGVLLLVCGGLITYLAIAQEGDSPAGGPPAQDPTEAPREISEAGYPIERVRIAGREFRLEVVDTDVTRYKGLSGREEVAEDGGMLFVFPRWKVGVHEFVMRECLVPIDIIFLDEKMRITATHHMPVEEARREDEPQVRDPRMDRYFQRLKRYSSRFPSQFAIELKGGTLEKMREDPEVAKKLEVGQVIELDARELLKTAR